LYTRAIVRRPGRNFANGITTSDLGKPDFTKALEQHAAYCEALTKCGLDLTVLDADEVYPDLKILMQTVFEDDEKLFASIRAGADGYILKKTTPQLLISSIHDAIEGGSPMTPSIAKQVLRYVGSTESKKENHDFKLTTREQEILYLLVQGLSYKMIAQKCFISLPTVSSHIQKIYEKLHVNSKSEAVAKAFKDKIV